jgi:hypothetical protein
MKLRIRDNSIRLRLTRGEVDSLHADGLVKARTEFAAGPEFAYVLESSPASVQPEAFFSDRVITIRVPEAMALAWASSEQVSINGEQTLDDGGLLTILVEKDFTCLAPREGEDESDMFSNPQADSGKGQE